MFGQMFAIDYDEPLFRPPSEAYSLIFQVTLGCSWNKCAFCLMYRNKRFRVRDEAEVLDEIRRAGAVYPGVQKVFLADGNALVLSTPRLLRILNTLREVFPGLRRVSSYALPGDLMSRTPRELEQLQEAGLKLIYVGIESGDDEVLRMINKCETADSTVNGLLKAREAGIDSSVMIVNGLAGREYSRQHALNSAGVLNKIQPRFFSTLVLTLPQGVEGYRKSFDGNYEPMEVGGLLTELELLLEHTDLERTVFRSDHVSNLVVLKGTLSRDKETLLGRIRHCAATGNVRDRKGRYEM